MLNVDLAFRKLGRLVQPVVETERVAIDDALGRIAAVPIEAPIDLPPFDASAMDGYAVDATGFDDACDKHFKIIDEARAGRPAAVAISAPGEAIRIFTGAMMPQGADAVILQEDVVVRGGGIATSTPIRRDQHVRHRGHDIKRGAGLCSRGTRLSHFHLAWFAACGIAEVAVSRRIRVGVFSTGDELIDRGTPLQDGQIYDSNRFALISLMREKQVDAFDLGCLPDDPDVIADSLGKASRSSDLIVTSGGVSVGDADFVKQVVDRIGRLEFWKIALKPGKPLAVGSIGNALFVGLPGNPVSAIVTYLLFVAPTIDRLGGRQPPPPLTLTATLDGYVKHSAGRREYLRGTLKSIDGKPFVTPTGDQGSNRLATFADANCLIVVKEDRQNMKVGEPVEIIMLPDEGAHPMRG